MVADIEGLEVVAPELHARRLNVVEVLTPQRSGSFIFAVEDGTVKIFGREQRSRTSTLTRDCSERASWLHTGVGSRSGSGYGGRRVWIPQPPGFRCTLESTEA